MVRRTLLIVALTLATGLVGVNAASALGPVDLLTDANVRIDGAAADDLAGVSVSAAGDMNGDGLGDVIVGAYMGAADGRPDSGSAYVIYGRAVPAGVDLAALGSAGFRIDGAAAGDRAGISVSGAGDVNGDGLDDVIVGALAADNNGRVDSGSAYVIYGRVSPADVDLASLGSAGFRIDGAAANDQTGIRVSGAGDLNGDGFDDVIAAATFADHNGRVDSGSAYVIYGGASLSGIDLADPLGPAGFRIDGAAANDSAGTSVSGAGDVDGDGFDDVIVGAQYADHNGRDDSGSAYVIYGGASLSGIDLADPLGPAGFRIDGAVDGDLTGVSASGAGDVDGDGIDDVIVGAFLADSDGRVDSGAAYVVYGHPGPVDVDLASLGSAGFRIDGAAAGYEAGASVSGAGDVNGDGFGDVIVGSYMSGAGGRIAAGSTHVIYGQASPARVDLASFGSAGFRIDGAGQDDQSGLSVAGAGDVNGDGLDDVIVGAPGADTDGRANSGAAYIVYSGLSLRVNLAGTGRGTVTSSPAGIDCRASCDTTFGDGRAVALVATPLAGSTFTGWSGACSGSGPACLVTMNEAREVTATFVKPPVPADPPNNNTAIFSPTNGKLKIRLKCGGQYKPRCLTMNARAVAGTGKRAKVMSNAATAKKVKAGKWKLTALKVKPKFRNQMKNMGKKKAKTLWVRIRVTWKKNGRKRARTVHHRYRVLVRE